MQHGGEDRPLDRELEAARRQQFLDHRPAAGLLPQPAEQQRRADAPAGEMVGIAGLELRQHHGALGIAGHRGGEALQPAGGDHGLLAAQILDDALLGAAVLANGLDQVQVGVAVDALLADEHARLAPEVAGFRQPISASKQQNLASRIWPAAAQAKADQRLTRPRAPKSGLHCSSWARDRQFRRGRVPHQAAGLAYGSQPHRARRRRYGRLEQSVAFRLEQAARQGLIRFYARNEGMDLSIPYELGVDHGDEPDFLVRMATAEGEPDLTLLLEVKGLEDNQTTAKHDGARRWVRAVNSWGKLGLAGVPRLPEPADAGAGVGVRSSAVQAGGLSDDGQPNA